MRTRVFRRPSPTGIWCLCCASLVAAQVLALSALPLELAEPGATLLHLLSYAAITLLLWIATDGRHPNFVIGAVLALGAFNDFPAALASALACAGLLYWRQGAGKPCAESSRRSRTET